MDFQFTIEELNSAETADHVKISLPELTPEEKDIINPLVPPTSGLRMKLLKQKPDGVHIATASIHALFLRMFRAISDVCGTRKGAKLQVLLVSDDRPTSALLLDEAARIFLAEGNTVYFQEAEGNTSPVSTPYGSAAIALFEQLDVVIVITASHNSVVWNGIKFYYELPIPISGDLMQEVSEKAMRYPAVNLLKSLPEKIPRLPVDRTNNEYIMRLLARIIKFKATKGKKVVFWPFWGKAQGMVDLLEGLGVDLVLIEENVNPPDPTVMTDAHKERVITCMKESGARLAILVDADRDRVVFILAHGGEYITLTPNELYTAMHNILVKTGVNLVNVRTIPSDPRCDDQSLVNFIAGVGYKHLGVILYLLTGKLDDESKFKTGILYYLKNGEYEHISEREQVTDPFQPLIDAGKIKAGDDLVFVLWEESGGHTFNLLKVESVNPLSFSSEFPLIGDKFPAPAICILTELVNRGDDLLEAIDQSIKFHRVEIHAEDKEKLAMMKKFEDFIGQDITFGDYTYKVVAFKDNEGETETIGFQRKDTILFFRPSGTGPAVRVYIFGPETTYIDEIQAVKSGIEARFK